MIINIIEPRLREEGGRKIEEPTLLSSLFSLPS
jgi:hypothetical protein